MSPAFDLFRTDTVIDSSTPPKASVRKKLKTALEAAGRMVEPGREQDAIRRFQKETGLKVDGIIRPGGETEGALNLFANTAKRGGPTLVDAIKLPMKKLANDGIVWTSDPGKSETMGMMRDKGKNGRRVTSTEVARALGDPGPGFPDLTGKDRIFLERIFGKPAAEKVVRGNTGAGSSNQLSGGMRERSFNSGAVKRAADRIASTADANSREAHKITPPHRDIRKIKWEKRPAGSVLDDRFEAKVKDTIRVDMSTSTLGLDGLRYTVEWHPLDERGKVMHEVMNKPRSPTETGGHSVPGLTSSRVFVSPFPNKHGFLVRIKIDPQPQVHGNSFKPNLNVFVPNGELKSIVKPGILND